jgi:dsDNA-binding SOS-regulon protein
MAVITRYVIVRDGVELDKVFSVKKEADAYDKMLDAADNLAAFIRQGDFEADLNEETIRSLSVYLAKNAPQVTGFLKGIRLVTPAPKAEGTVAPPSVDGKKAPGKKTAKERK